jgi:hypothetical protein
MPARSRAANRLSLLLLLALQASCAHGAKPAVGAAVFKNERGERIVIGLDAITIAGVTHPLTDCSDAEWICASSDIGFRVSFPRKCPGFAWLAQEGRMTMLSMWPHGGGGRYASRDSSHFVYQWQNRYGLTGLVYDPKTNFAAPGSDDPLGGPTSYEKKSGPRLFACR